MRRVRSSASLVFVMRCLLSLRSTYGPVSGRNWIFKMQYLDRSCMRPSEFSSTKLYLHTTLRKENSLGYTNEIKQQQNLFLIRPCTLIKKNNILRLIWTDTAPVRRFSARFKVTSWISKMNKYLRNTGVSWASWFRDMMKNRAQRTEQRRDTHWTQQRCFFSCL